MKMVVIDGIAYIDEVLEGRCKDNGLDPEAVYISEDTAIVSSDIAIKILSLFPNKIKLDDKAIEIKTVDDLPF